MKYVQPYTHQDTVYTTFCIQVVMTVEKRLNLTGIVDNARILKKNYFTFVN